MREQQTERNQPGYDVWVAPGRITIIDNAIEQDEVIESVPVPVPTIEEQEPLRFVFPVFFGSHLAIVLVVLSLFLLARVTTTPAQITLYLSGIPEGMVEVKSLPPISLTQSTTVRSTGHVHIQATQAHGLIYFYNSLTQAQTIQAGMLLVGSDGVQVVTDEAVTIPGSNPPTMGQASVQTHALSPGVRGNIQAGDISGPCCLAFIQVANSQFHGGQDAQDIQTVTASDISSTSTVLLSRLNASVQERLAALPLSPQEARLSPVRCTTSTTANHKAGNVAASVTVSVRQVCIPQYYSIQELKRTLLTMVAGKTPDQAKAILARHGLYSVSIKLSFLQDRIPSDTRKIQLSLLFS